MGKKKTISITKKWLRDLGCSPEEVEKYSGKYTLERWRFGAKKRAQTRATSFVISTQETDFDAEIFAIEKFVACIKECPFPLTPTEIKNLPDFLGEKLEDEINILIGFSEEEAKNLESVSNEES